MLVNEYGALIHIVQKVRTGRPAQQQLQQQQPQQQRQNHIIPVEQILESDQNHHIIQIHPAIHIQIIQKKNPNVLVMIHQVDKHQKNDPTIIPIIPIRIHIIHDIIRISLMSMIIVQHSPHQGQW